MWTRLLNTFLKLTHCFYNSLLHSCNGKHLTFRFFEWATKCFTSIKSNLFIRILKNIVFFQKTLITSIQDENPEFTVDGYTSLGITYTVFALSLWLGPSMVSLTGPRYGMALAALGYT